jgi:flagellin-like hook-associated protein FlgL
MRVSTLSTFSQVLLGLHANQLRSLRAQEQLSSGRRILRPSDDPAGAARALLLSRELAGIARTRGSIGAGQTLLEGATAGLQHAGNLMVEARELLLQGMNGTLNDQDRLTVASAIEELREQLLDEGNLRVDERYVFGGTRSDAAPWEELTLGGRTRVVYRGDGAEQRIRAGEEAEIGITISGADVFGRAVFGPTRYDGLTGVRSGTTADEGSGYAYLDLRHDSTDIGALSGIGILLVEEGQHDTLLGSDLLTLDGTAGTLRLGDGPPVSIPPASSSERADVVVVNESGAELHLDLSGWTGSSFAGSVSGAGSISLDGEEYVALTLAETDLELVDAAAGLVLHVDTTSVKRAGKELVTFGSTVNAFDLLQGIAEDLRNADGLEASDVHARLSQRLSDLDRVHEDMLLGIGVLGSRSARLADADARALDLDLELSQSLSRVEDADLAGVAL